MKTYLVGGACRDALLGLRSSALVLQNIDYRKLANIYDGDQLLQQIRKTRYVELKKIIEVQKC